MALKNIIDPERARLPLARWYADRHPETEDVRVLDIHIPHANGMSSETILFDLAFTENGRPQQQPLVARVAPTSGGLFPTYDLAREKRVLDAVGASTSVPVPAVLGVEQDDSILGAPFLIMQRLYGRVPSDDPPFTAQGWVTELSAAEQAALYDNALVAMAAIHSADITTLDPDTVGHPAHGAGTVAHQLAHYERLYDWTAAGRSHPVLDPALEWIHANLPTREGTPGLSWGDARIGNMMFGDKLEVTAVLDWEMATIGEAELDLAWFLFLNRNHSEGIGLPAIPGFPSREQTIDRFEQLLGRPLLNFDFHEVFAAVRASIIMMRVGTVLIEAGLLPADADMPVNNPASRLLATILDLPTAAGAATWITGNR